MVELSGLISVVIPVYNVEKYLNTCVKSVVNQSYCDLEIILVDDGSTDSCGLICDEWLRQDARIKVIHKKNGGLSSARNIGIEYATGDFISFIDSDDIIHKDMLFELRSCFEGNPKMQISACGYLEVRNDKEIPESLEKKRYTQMTGKDAVLLMLDAKDTFNVVAWNKLYKKNLFDHVIYPDGYNHEDMYVTPRLLYESEMVAYIPTAYYYHRYNPNSIVNGKYSIKSQDEILGVEAMHNYFVSVNCDKAIEKVNRIYLWKLIDNTAKTYYWIDEYEGKTIIHKLTEKYRRFYLKNIINTECTVLEKVQFVIFFGFPRLYCRIRKKKYLLMAV